MKSIAKFLLGITVVAVLFLAYYLLSSRLSCALTVSVQPATGHLEVYNQVKEKVKNGEYSGFYSLDAPENYSLVTFKISARNFSPFSAEWTQFIARPQDGNMLIVEAAVGPKDIKSFSTEEFFLTFLTETPEQYTGGWLEYYIFGRFHSLDVAVSEQ